MINKTAFLYAGQGSQKTGMGRDFYDEYNEFKEVFDNIVLDFDLKEACFKNPNNILLNTQYTQPCMVAFACGVTEILKKKGINPDYVCGLSLGEYSALYAAGVWSLEDTMRIISIRGRAMAEVSVGIETAMVAIMSLSKDKVTECCKKARCEGVVSICNLNCPGQVVIGGDKKAVEYATQLAKESGARRCIPLSVSGPFHTVYMKKAGDELESALKTMKCNKPQCGVLYNYLGGPNQDKMLLPELLINQIQSTVRMQDCIEYLINEDLDTFIEIGPGTAISGFVKKTIKAKGKKVDDYHIISINETKDIDALLCI